MTVLALIGAVLCTAALLWGVAAYATPPAGTVAEPSYEILQVFSSEEEAVRQLFPESTTFHREPVTLSAGQVGAVDRLAGHRWDRSSEPVIYTATAANGRLVGRGVVMNELGKHHDITFMVGVTPEGAVRAVEILVYRESRGGEVRQRRFLRQFRGKGLGDAIRGGVDIVNVTGATLSVNAISRGVRKALALIQVLYGQYTDGH